MALFTVFLFPQYYGRNQKVNSPTNVEFFSMECSRGCLSVLTGISIHNGKETSIDVARWKWWPIPAYHIQHYAWFAISVGNFRYDKYTGHFRYHKHSKPCKHFKFYEHDKWCTYWKYFRHNKYHRRRKHYKHYNKSKWAGFLQVNISFSNTRKCVGLLHNYFWVLYLPMRENQSNLRLISLLHSHYYGRHATLE